MRRGICAGFDWRFARNRVKQCCAQTVNVAAEVSGRCFSLSGATYSGVPQTTPPIAQRCGRCAGETEVADFCCVFIDKQNISRLHIAVNQTSSMRSTQSPCNLDANLEDPLFR
jgi:hypothetical protein